MSQANVEVVVKQFEGANARDFAGVMDAWAEDVTLILHWSARSRRPISSLNGSSFDLAGALT
jgi:hypothetical protein